MEIKILAAVDGSVYSSNSLDYLVRLFNQNPDFTVHLFSVVSSVGVEQDWMLDVDPLRPNPPALERRLVKAKRYLHDAKQRLLRGGFRDEQISFSTATTSSEIAAAIHHEAVTGSYDSLLLGRRGIGKVGEMFYGSVSGYLLEKCHEAPIWLIDGEVHSTRYLLAVHCMPQSLRAADHLGFIVHSDPGVEICLYHSSSLFGNQPPALDSETYHEAWGKEWCDEHLDRENNFMNAHKRILMDHGVPEEAITILPTKHDIDPSRDLLKQAKKHHCGTIILGRRGPGFTKGFLGGVSDRLIRQAADVAVWMLS